MASEESQPKPSCPVSSGGGGGDELAPSKSVGKASAIAKCGATLPVLEHTSSSAASAESRVSPTGHPKASTFAGRYPPSQPQHRAAWDKLVQDFDKQKVEDKKKGKRSMSQAEWYSRYSEGYGLQVRKKRAVMKKPAGQDAPAGHEAAADGDEESPPGLSEEGAHEPVDGEEEEEEEEYEEEVAANPGWCQPGERVRGGLIERSFQAHKA